MNCALMSLYHLSIFVSGCPLTDLAALVLCSRVGNLPLLALLALPALVALPALRAGYCSWAGWAGLAACAGGAC